MEGRRRREYCWICRRGTVHIFTHTLQEDVATGEYALCEACQPFDPIACHFQERFWRLLGCPPGCWTFIGCFSAAWKQCYSSDRYDSPTDVDQQEIIRQFDALEFDIEELKQGTKTQAREWPYWTHDFPE